MRKRECWKGNAMNYVSVNEILSGKRLSREEYKAAEENLRCTVKASSICCWGLGVIAVFVAGVILTYPLLMAAAMLLLVLGHAWRNNTMMVYVEQNAFDGATAYK